MRPRIADDNLASWQSGQVHSEIKMFPRSYEIFLRAQNNRVVFRVFEKSVLDFGENTTEKENTVEPRQFELEGTTSFKNSNWRGFRIAKVFSSSFFIEKIV